VSPGRPARLAAAARALARRPLARRARPASAPAVRVAAPGAEPRTLAAGDPRAVALMEAAKAVLSAAERAPEA
jgi:hypothetical protein